MVGLGRQSAEELNSWVERAAKSSTDRWQKKKKPDKPTQSSMILVLMHRTVKGIDLYNLPGS